MKIVTRQIASFSLINCSPPPPSVPFLHKDRLSYAYNAAKQKQNQKKKIRTPKNTRP